MNICIFPGTFNPIHMAHINMAKFAIEKYGFEKIIFIPAYIPPHKLISSNLAIHRYNMVKLVCNNNPKFEISNIEFESEGKSYTIYTVKKIRQLYNIKHKLSMIIGTDAFNKIKTWYQAEELKDLVHFIVFQRGGDIINKDEFIGYSYEFANAEKYDISSSEIRESKKGDISKEVKEYINKNELYN